MINAIRISFSVEKKNHKICVSAGLTPGVGTAINSSQLSSI